MRDRWIQLVLFDFKIEGDDADGLDFLAGFDCRFELPFFDGAHCGLIEFSASGRLLDRQVKDFAADAHRA